jgi:predicted acetyltransferase
LIEPLEYRFAGTDDVPVVARLLAHSFPAIHAQPQEWWEQNLATPWYGGTPETTLLVGELGGRIVAACQLHPMQQWIGGEAFAMCGIGSVGISPVHRRRHYGAALVTEALRIARERGDIVSALYPFRSTFYRNLGWGQADEAQQFHIEPQLLPDSPERVRVELLETDDARADALSLYGEWCRTQTGQLERNASLWSRICEERDQVLAGYRNEDGRLEGYALALYRTEVGSATRFLEVDELVWTTPAARRGLYGWLGSMGDQWRGVVLRALPSHRLADWISEPRLPRGSAPVWRLWAPAATLMMGTMFRLLHVERAWTQRRIERGGTAFSAIIDVADAQLPDNSGTWRLRFEDGRVLVEKAAREPDVRTDISTLSRIFIGALPASAAHTAGLLECSRTELLPRLDAVLALPEPWTFDRF